MRDENVKIIENAEHHEVRQGDHVTWERSLVTDSVIIWERREGITAHQDHYGVWSGEDGTWIVDGPRNGGTITIRRNVKALPNTTNSVIVPADGHKRIEAVMNGKTWYTREAVLGAYGLWIAAWRSDTDSIPGINSEEITEGTWKEDTE